MTKNSTFFIKIFCTIMAFFYVIPLYAALDPVTKTICNENEYLVSCGDDILIGTYWLMGDNTTSTQNIYDYSDNSSYVNMENLRKFFKGEAIEYTDKDGTLQSTAEQNINVKNMSSNMIKQKCLKQNTSCKNCKCEKCSTNTLFPASTLTINGSSMNVYISDIYTIADCYQDSFFDSTGTYKYLKLDENETVDPSKPGEKCYYNTEVTGTAFVPIDQPSAGSTGDTTQN